MSTLYSHVRAAVSGVPWLVHPPMMSVIVDVLSARVAGQRFTDAEIAARIEAAERRAGPRRGGGKATRVAIVPVYGVLAHRAEYFAETSSSGSSVQSIERAFQSALEDPEVDAILFDIDSPGGQAAGIPEFAEKIRAARGQKPMVAISNTLMASAAMWIGAQADELIVTPSSLTGSVGVVMGHVDESAALEQDGVKVTLVYAGEYKVETYPETALSDDARAHMQSLVDDMYRQFVGAMAKGRGTSEAAVRSDFGKGRIMAPRDAVKSGLADRIDTYEGALTRLASGKVKPRDGGSSAAIDIEKMSATVLVDTEVAAKNAEDGYPAAVERAMATSADAVDAVSRETDEPALDEVALVRAIASRRR